MSNLAFNSKTLEKRFGSFLKENPGVEVGGVIVAYRGTKSFLDRDGFEDRELMSTAFICQVHIFPNLSRNPHRSYRFNPYQQREHFEPLVQDAIARKDNKILIYHWHSHPNGNTRPSRRDLITASQVGFGYLIGHTVVATAKPLRMTHHRLAYGQVVTEHSSRIKYESSKFFSWSRSPRLRRQTQPACDRPEIFEFVETKASAAA